MAKRGRKSIAGERRAQILDAFHRCAVRKGLEKTSLREVAEEAGLPVSILHHYFKNRDEMVSELVKGIMTGIIENLRAEFESASDPQTRFEKVIDSFFSPKAQKLEDGSLYYDCWSLAHRSKTVRRTLRDLIREEREGFVEMLLETESVARLPKSDMKQIANIIVALVEGAFYVLDMDGENVSPKRMAFLIRRFIELYAEDRSR